MKTRITIAVAVGALASILLDILDKPLHSPFLQYLALPGHIAIILIWGAHGMDRSSESVALIVGTGVNAIVYSLIIAGVLKWFDRSHESRRPKDE